MKKFTVTAIASTLALSGMTITMALAANDGSCQPGPRCTAANAAGQQAIAELQRRELSQPSMAVAARANYCAQQAVAFIADICGNEFEKMKQPRCAELSYRQRDASQTAARQSGNVHPETNATRKWVNTCEISNGHPFRVLIDTAYGQGAGGRR